MVVLQERDTNGTVQATHTWGLDLSGLLAATDSSGNHVYFSSDIGGNVTALFNSSGIVLARYLYDPYGNLLGKWGTLADANRYLFSSKELHANSGLLYFGFRFYDPNLQRWVNQDPIREAGGRNVHAFVGNDPVNQGDSFGLWGWDRGLIQWGLFGAAINASDQMAAQQRMDAMAQGVQSRDYANPAELQADTGWGGGVATAGMGRETGLAAAANAAAFGADAYTTVMPMLANPAEGFLGTAERMPGMKVCWCKWTPKSPLAKDVEEAFVHRLKEFDVVPYSRPVLRFEKHHGVLDAWARANVPAYSGRTAPTMVLTPAQHNATRAVFNVWRGENGWARQAVDWRQVSPQQIQSLAYRMFKAANVPDEAIARYFREFNGYIYGR